MGAFFSALLPCVWVNHASILTNLLVLIWRFGGNGSTIRGVYDSQIWSINVNIHIVRALFTKGLCYEIYDTYLRMVTKKGIG